MAGTPRAVGMRKPLTLALALQKGQAPAAGLYRDIKHFVRTPRHRPRAAASLGGSAPEGQVGKGPFPSRAGAEVSSSSTGIHRNSRPFQPRGRVPAADPSRLPGMIKASRAQTTFPAIPGLSPIPDSPFVPAPSIPWSSGH